MFTTVAYGQVDQTDSATGAHIDRTLYAERVLEEINGERASRGLPALQRDEDLQQLAVAWAEHLAATGEFRHRPDLLSRVKDLGFTSISENVWRSDQPLPPERVVSTWLESTGHAQNLRSGRSTLGAVGVAQATSGRVVVVFQGGARSSLDEL